MEPNKKSNKKVLWPEEVATKLFEQYQTMLNSKLYSKDMEMVEILAASPEYKGIYTAEQIKSKIKNQKHSISMKNLAKSKEKDKDNDEVSLSPSTPTGSGMITRRHINNNSSSVSSSNTSNNNNNINNSNNINNNHNHINDINISNNSIGNISYDNESDSSDEDDEIFRIEEEVVEEREPKRIRLSSLGNIPNTMNAQSSSSSSSQPNNSTSSSGSGSGNMSLKTTLQENKILKSKIEQLEFQLKLEKEQNISLKKLCNKLNDDIQTEKEITKQGSKKLLSIIDNNLNLINAKSISSGSVLFKKDKEDNSIVAIFPTTPFISNSKITLTIDNNPPIGFYKILIINNQQDHQTYLIKRFETHHDPEPCIIGSTKGIYFKSKDPNLFKFSIETLKDLDYNNNNNINNQTV